MKTTLFAAVLAALFTVNVQAESVGLYLGGQIGQSEAKGVFGEKNTPMDSNVKKEQQIYYFVAVEHPFPLLPNARISTAKLNTTGNRSFTQESSFDNETSHVNLQSDIAVDASFDASYVDYTIYYQLFDNDLFSFDLGLTARDFNVVVSETKAANTITTSRDFIWDGEEHIDHDYHSLTETTNTVTTDKIKTNQVEPMMYFASNISLPLTGLSVFGQGDFLLKDDYTLYDYQVGLSYDLIDSRKGDFNLTLGYRVVKMEFEDLDNLSTELEFKGAFVGVNAHF